MDKGQVPAPRQGDTRLACGLFWEYGMRMKLRLPALAVAVVTAQVIARQHFAAKNPHHCISSQPSDAIALLML